MPEEVAGKTDNVNPVTMISYENKIYEMGSLGKR
jgi:hypothetical protein